MEQKNIPQQKGCIPIQGWHIDFVIKLYVMIRAYQNAYHWLRVNQFKSTLEKIKSLLYQRFQHQS